jgi:hypothetical protein
LRVSGKRTRSSLRVFLANLGSRASYRLGGRGPLPMDPVVTPPFNALTGEAPGLGLPPNPDIEINPTASSAKLTKANKYKEQ